jgi:hypothetical protein
MTRETTMSEDSYFQEREQEKLAALRRKRQLAALRDEEREGIAAVLGTDDEVAEAAMLLGFDAETSRILFLIPLIQVAWADGSISKAENERVRQLAADRGIDLKSPASEFLELLLNQQPSDSFFDRTNELIRRLLKSESAEAGSADLLAHCKDVAKVSGGFFGFGNAIDGQEQSLLKELASLFDVGSQD